MSKISYERRGKIFEETILQTLKFVPAFLSSHYLSYSLRYDFMKIKLIFIKLVKEKRKEKKKKSRNLFLVGALGDKFFRGIICFW